MVVQHLEDVSIGFAFVETLRTCYLRSGSLGETAFGTNVSSTASIRLSSRLVLADALENTSRASAIALFCVVSPTPSKSNLTKPVFPVRTVVRFNERRRTRHPVIHAQLELLSHRFGFLYCRIRDDRRKFAIRKEGVCHFRNQACGGVDTQGVCEASLYEARRPGVSVYSPRSCTLPPTHLSCSTSRYKPF
jgi:hypothetical protein